MGWGPPLIGGHPLPLGGIGFKSSIAIFFCDNSNVPVEWGVSRMPPTCARSMWRQPPADPHDPYGSYESYAPAGALKPAHFEG
jgi:hypothetical protein